MSDVVDNTERHRFEFEVDGHVAKAHYTLAPGIITFTHTVVPPELAGRGIGSILARGALDAVRARGLKVIPQCPFIAAFVGKHPDYADLVVDGYVPAMTDGGAR